MIVIDNISIADVDEILHLWKNNFDEKYHIDKNTFIKKVFDDIDFYYDDSFILKIDGKIIGVIIIKLNNRNIKEYDNCAWLNTLLIDKRFRKHGYGSLLYGNSEEKLKDLGIKKILLGGDVYNFFSGIPEPKSDVELFFKKKGFKLNEFHYDLMADVSELDFNKLDIEINMESVFLVKELQLNNIEKLNKFFDKNFPGRWKYEINNYIKYNGDLRNVILLWNQNDIIGFCKIDININKNGSLGPIGIDKNYRGKKLGNKLLCESLKFLKSRGTKNVFIDWTILKEFYGQFGFKPYKFFKSGFKEIGGILNVQ